MSYFEFELFVEFLQQVYLLPLTDEDEPPYSNL